MFDRRPEVGAGVADVDMDGRTVVVTGSTSGIGRETALAFGRLGARVVVHGRDRERGRTVADEIGDATFLRADFSTTEAVREFADAVREATDRIDVLVNNAGSLFRADSTVEGLEKTFAVNHLAPFALTLELLPALRATGGRVVTVSSDAHRGGSMDLDAVESPEGGTGFRAYARSKLANVLFTLELDRRLARAHRDAGDGDATAGHGSEDDPAGDRDDPDAADVDPDPDPTPPPSADRVTANCLHPGAIPGTDFARNAPLPVRVGAAAVGALPAALQRPFVTTVREGAETPVYLGASPAVAGVGGGYFVNCRRRTPSRAARDEETARRLWATSEEYAGIESPV